MKQFYLLDLIRGVTALLVVMGHLRSLMFESWNGGNLFKVLFYAIHLPVIFLVIAFFTQGKVLEFNLTNFIFYIIIINLILLVSFVFWSVLESKTYIVGSYLNNFIKNGGVLNEC